MRSGSQWNDTYHFSRDDKYITNTDHGHYSLEPEEMPDWHQPDPSFIDEFSSSFGEGERNEGKAVQGMFFPPATGTGTGEDPLVTQNARRAAIRDSYGLSEDRYETTYQVITNKSSEDNVIPAAKVSPEQRNAHREAAIKSIEQSDIPMHEMAKNNPDVVAAPRDMDNKSGYAGFYRGEAGPRGIAFTKTEDREAYPVFDGDTFASAHPAEAVAPPSTMVHEIGHGRHLLGRRGDDVTDSHRIAGRKADPLYEGAADGYKDRFAPEPSAFSWDIRHTDDLDSPQYMEQMSHRQQSYGTNSSRWKTSAESALYAATRRLSAGDPDNLPHSYRDKTIEMVGKDPVNDRPDDMSRHGSSYFEASNVMALGRMMSENPEVRGLFGHNVAQDDVTWNRGHVTKMQTAARQSQGRYESALDKQKLKAAGNPVEQTLPGI